MDKPNVEIVLNQILHQVNKLDDKLSNHDDKLSRIDTTMVRNTMSLEEHMKRSDMLEDTINMTKDDLKPIQSHVKNVEGIFKFFGVISVIVSIAAGIVKIFEAL